MRTGRLTWLLAGLVTWSVSLAAGHAKNGAQSPATTQAPASLPLPSREPVLPPRWPVDPPAADDTIGQLVHQAQSLYEAGVSDYRSDNLEKAKEEFDRALEVMLESNLDVEDHERLNAEFDRLVENIYDMEVAALERGDMLSAHNYEPPPIESFAGLTFPVDPNVKQHAQQELESVHSDLPLVSNDYVDGVLTFLQNHGRHYIQTVLERKGLYEPMISEVLAKDEVPQDLIYLAAGESAFNPHALSKAGAKGIWQFMPGTAALYGLRKDRWVDEREDPLKCTEAAARHLKDLYRTFGDWFLAMAAYDWSPAGVQKAIEKTGYADFWKLRELHALPAETQNYVPIFLATALIAKDPQAYGFDVTPDAPLAVDRVTVNVPTDVRLIAQLIDHPVEELIRLNPSLLAWVTPPNDSNFLLNLPAGTKESYERTIAAIPPDRRIWWRAYKVLGGETLAAIARKYRISPASLAQANRVGQATPLEAGVHLVLPLSPGRDFSLVRVHERAPRHPHQYRVRSGDTLELIADRFDVSSYQIRRWNHLGSSHLTPGKTLVVYASSAGGSRPSLENHAHSSGRRIARKSPIASRRTRTSSKRTAKLVGTGAQAAR